MRMSRELDAEVAEKVMGIRKIFRPCDIKSASESYFGSPTDYVYIPSGKPPRTHMIDAKLVPHYSTNISAAMEVVEKMQEAGYDVEMLAHSQWWWVVFKKTHEPMERH